MGPTGIGFDVNPKPESLIYFELGEDNIILFKTE
jgi:hypothetical protein